MTNKEEIAALQQGQVEACSQIVETQGHLAAVENFLKSIESMLKDALKMKSPLHDSRSHSHNNGEHPMFHMEGNHHWQRGIKAELPMFDGVN